jgi:multimeric flavodoxin WrbA
MCPEACVVPYVWHVYARVLRCRQTEEHGQIYVRRRYGTVYNRPQGRSVTAPRGRYCKMKILGICGSPRKGNTEWMLTKVLESAKTEGAGTELILLRDKDIRLCKGCLTCEVGRDKKPGKCILKDDMEPLLAKMLAADVIAFGTPSYFYMLSGLLKNFMDRTVPIWPLLKGKRAAGVAVAEDTLGRALENLRTYADLCEMQWIGEVSALAKEPGEVAENKAVADLLSGLGRKLAARGE